MAVAEAAKIVFQTALAGTLESKGFRRVSDTNYVIEGDAIEWRVIFGPEYKDEPGTFLDATGIFIPEIDRLNLALPNQTKPLSEPMARTKYRAHFRDYLSGLTDRRLSYVDDKNFDPCFVKLGQSQEKQSHWDAEDQDWEALGHRIDNYWKLETWPWLEHRLSLETACGPLPKEEWRANGFRGSWGDILGWWVCGHKDYVIEELETIERDARLSDDEIRPLIRERLRRNSILPFDLVLRRVRQSEIDEWRDYRVREMRLAQDIKRVIGLI